MPSVGGHDDEDDQLPSRSTRKESFARISGASTQGASPRRMGQQARTTWRIRTDNRRQCSQSVAHDLTWYGVLLLDEQPKFNCKRLEIEGRPLAREQITTSCGQSSWGLHGYATVISWR